MSIFKYLHDFTYIYIKSTLEMNNIITQNMLLHFKIQDADDSKSGTV